MAARNPASRSSSPWNVLLDSEISTVPGCGPAILVIT